MKYILISISIFINVLFMSGCSQKEAYETFRHSDKYYCENIINTEDRIKCQNAKRASYEEYQDYLKKTDKNGM